MRQTHCNKEACDRRHKAKGYCDRHYQNFLKYGKPESRLIKRGGDRKHPLYATFYNMIQRCKNPNNIWYKARGIEVCSRWSGENGFAYFLEDMGERPDGFQLDRIDNNKGYSPENCRWVGKYEQMGNTRATKYIPGVTYSRKLNKFRARIKVQGKEIMFGWFTNLEDAVKARKEGEKKYI